MPRALFRIQGGKGPFRETAFATPKRMGGIQYWWKACRKTWPDLPLEYNQANITTDTIVFSFTMIIYNAQEASATERTGKIHIDRNYKFGSQ